MKAIAINPRRSCLKNARVHFVREQTRVAFCGLAGRNGWRDATGRAVDCPRCQARMKAELDRLPSFGAPVAPAAGSDPAAEGERAARLDAVVARARLVGNREALESIAENIGLEEFERRYGSLIEGGC
jgi:hypothetical protein